MIDCERRIGAEGLRPNHDRRVRREVNQLSLTDSDRSRRQPLFVDNTRFWSMVATVGLHSAQAVSSMSVHDLSFRALVMLEALEKFGTIGFFFVSGFLLGDRFETAKASAFLGRRLKKICLPWLVWFVSTVVDVLGHQWINHTLRFRLDLSSAHIVFLSIVSCLSSTPFWFVPNLFLSVFLLMLFGRFLRSPWLGYAFMAVTGFYPVNIYTNWIPSSHFGWRFLATFFVREQHAPSIRSFRLAEYVARQ
jgi:hypothetical protein